MQTISRSRRVRLAIRSWSGSCLLRRCGLCVGELAQDLAEQGPVQPDLAGIDFVDGAKDDVGRFGLVHHAARAFHDHVPVNREVVFSREHQHAGEGVLAQRDQRIARVFATEVEVEQDDVGASGGFIGQQLAA